MSPEREKAIRLKDQAMKAYKAMLEADYKGNRVEKQSKLTEYRSIYQMLGVSDMEVESRKAWEAEIKCIVEVARNEHG